MNAALATIFVTMIHLSNGHTAFAGVDATNPSLCLNAASNNNTQLQLYGWRAFPHAQRMALKIKSDWNTEIIDIEFTCMSIQNYNQIQDTDDLKYWTPIQK